MARSTGRGKWFNAVKGYGFIKLTTPGDGGEEVFVHHSAIKMDGYRKLDEGQAVTLDVVQGKNGLAAENVEQGDVQPYAISE
jgi:CspA family cold shock protein